MLELGPIVRMLWRNKMGVALVAVQMAVALAIISNAAFVIHERRQLIARPTGVAEAEVFGLAVMALRPEPRPYALVQRDLEAIRALPGVIEASFSSQFPLSGSGSSTTFKTDDVKRPIEGQANYFYTNERGLDALGLKLIAGRNFRPEEMLQSRNTSDDEPQVIIVSKALGEQMFGAGVEPVGRQILSGSHRLEVIGVVDPFLGSWVDWEYVGHTALLPVHIIDAPIRYIVRSHAEQRARLMTEVPDLLRQLDPERVVLSARAMDELKARSYRADSAMIRTLSTAIVLLTAVTALGIGGLTLFWVGQRRRQIGTRRALGASRAAILRLLLVENSLISALGLALGLVLALVVNQLMVEHYQMTALPPSYLLVTLGLLWLCATLSALAPAWRATTIPPAVATRCA